MELDLLIKKAKKKGSAEKDRLLVTFNAGGLSVYLDCRLLVQIRSGVVTAIQAHNQAQARLIQSIIKEEGLEERYTVTAGQLAEYADGMIISVRRMSDGRTKEDTTSDD
jgi:hypothetical protein